MYSFIFHIYLTIAILSYFRVSFAKHERVYSGEQIYHIELNLRDSKHLLFSEGNILVSYDMEQKKRISEYSFNTGDMRGFVQLNRDRIVWLDTTGNCIVKLKRNSIRPKAARLAGKCGASGVTDGRASVARFDNPIAIIIDKRIPSSVIVSDYNNKCLRSINVDHGEVSTLYKFDNSPMALLWFTEKLLVSTENHLYLLEKTEHDKNFTQFNGRSNYSFGAIEFANIQILELLNKDWIMATPLNSGFFIIINMIDNTIVPVCVDNRMCEDRFQVFNDTPNTIFCAQITDYGLHVGGEDEGIGFLYLLTGKLTFCFMFSSKFPEHNWNKLPFQMS